MEAPPDNEEWCSFTIISLVASLDETIEWIDAKKIPAGTRFYLSPPQVDGKDCTWHFDLVDYFNILGFKYDVVDSTFVIDKQGEYDPEANFKDLELTEDGQLATISSAVFTFKSDLPTNQMLTLGAKVHNQAVLDRLSSFRRAQLGRVKWDPPLSEEFYFSLKGEEKWVIDRTPLPILRREDMTCDCCNANN